MKNNQHYLLGTGSYPYKPSSEEFLNNIDFYASENFSLVSSRLPINMKPESHEHDSYEFTIPISHSPYLRVDNKEIIVVRNSLTSSNPGQTHGPSCNIEGAHFMAFQINREFIENISNDMSGKRHIIFDNEPVMVPANLIKQLREYAIENRSHQNGYKFIIETLSIQISVNILRNVKSNMPQHKEYASVLCNKNIRRAIEFMYEYYNSNFSVEDLAGVANLSKFHFIRVFKAETGKTPYEYLMDIKIHKAKQLLKERELTITEICFLLGFNDHSHFTKTFKMKTGCTPTEFISHII